MDSELRPPPGVRGLARFRPELPALATFLVVFFASLGFDLIPASAQSLHLAFLIPADTLVVWASLRAARRSGEVPWLRAFWTLLACAWIAELLADLSLATYAIALEDPTFPSVADLFFLAFYPLTLLALLRIPTARGSRSQRLRTALDCATIVAGGAAAVWYFVLGPIATEGGQGLLATVVSAAYPIADIVLLGALGLVLMRPRPEAVRAPLRYLAAGLGLLILADAIYSHGLFFGSYAPGDPVDSLYVLLAVPFVLAAAAQRRIGVDDPEAGVSGDGEANPRAGWLPLAAMLLGFGILLGTQWRDRFFPDLSLLLLAIALGGLAALRQQVAQTELRQLQGRVRTIVESVAEGIVGFDERGKIVWVNRAAEEIFGAPPGGLAGTPLERLGEGVGWAEMAPLVGLDGAPGPLIGKQLKFRGRRGDSSSFPVEAAITEARLDNERILIAIGQDVSERTRAERALRESERRFRGIFDNAGVGIAFSTFKDGWPRIVEVNAAFSRMLGYSAAELRGDDFSLITHPDDRGGLAEIGRAVEAGEDTVTREQRHQCKDGSFLWVSLTISILRDEGGEPRFAIGMLEDITRRKQAEQVKEEFVSVVGHELRTPLTSIRGSLGLLGGGVMGEIPDEAEEMLATAISNTDRLVRLINDILDIERLDSGRDEIESTGVPAADLVRHALEALSAMAAESEVELETAVEEVAVTADPDRIVQALVNLIGNAIKFSEPGSAVMVRVRREGAEARFSVCDRGRGIPADRLEAIFERFNQVDASDAREKGGTGLGLSIARSIVERHGGRIWAESEEGVGATFTFTLPVQIGDRVLEPVA